MQYNPNGYLGFVLKGGVEERDPDQSNTTVAAGYDQNPLMRKYELAYRYRSYGDFEANVSGRRVTVHAERERVLRRR